MFMLSRVEDRRRVHDVMQVMSRNPRQVEGLPDLPLTVEFDGKRMLLNDIPWDVSEISIQADDGIVDLERAIVGWIVADKFYFH